MGDSETPFSPDDYQSRTVATSAVCGTPSADSRVEAQTVLEEAAGLTAGDRQRDYDHPLPNHQRIARLWNAYLDCRREPEGCLSPEDVATMMILLKVARNVFTPKRDNLVDICGYARCLERMADYAEAVAENP